jgi:hypothetical protein
VHANPNLKNYFNSPLKLGAILMLVGIPLIAVMGLGVILIAIGGFMVFSALTAGGEADADKAMADAIRWAKTRAHEKTIIDEDEASGEIAARTEVLAGIYLKDDVLDKNRKPIRWGIRKGRDSRPRFNPVNVTVLIFGRDQIATYQTVIDLIGGKNYSETTEEYFYNDVIGIKNENQSWTRKDKKGKEVTTKYQDLSLVTNSGDRISVTVSVDESKGAADWSKYAADLEPQVNNIKKLLRERKSVRQSA